nr:hypothetical protein [Micromonospora purpureochromogenes]
MDGIDVRRARSWFWGLTLTAVAAMGGLYRELHGTPGPVTGLLTLLTALVLAASATQAARILAKLAAPPRPPTRRRVHRCRGAETRRTGMDGAPTAAGPGRHGRR